MAALAVVAAHVGGHAGVSLVTGAAGVDVFFVISGFIMWTVTMERPSGPGRFMVDRVTRILPPYALLTVAVYLLATRVPGAFPNMHTSISHFLLSLALVPHTDPYGTQFPVIVPGWTLNYEMFFYVVFAGCLTLSPRYRIWGCSAVLVLLALAGTAMGWHGAALHVYTNPLLLEFVAGLWLGVAWRGTMPRVGWGLVGLLAGIGWLMAWHFLFNFQPDAWRAAIWGLPAVGIVGGLLTIERRWGMARLPFLLLLGDASYAIYLVNVFIIAAVWRVMGSLGVPLHILAAFAATIVGGLLFWRCVERPATVLLRRWVKHPVPVIMEPIEGAEVLSAPGLTEPAS